MGFLDSINNALNEAFSGQSGTLNLINRDGLVDLSNSQGANPVAEPREPRGPLGKLETRFSLGDKTSLSYPQELSQDREYRYPHCIKINIFKPEQSNFNVEKTQSANLTQFDANRQTGQPSSQLIGEIPSGTATSALVGGAVALQTAASASAQAIKSSSPVDKLVAPLNIAIGSGAAGFYGGFLSTVVQRKIDLRKKAKQLEKNIYLYVPDQVIMQTQHQYNETSVTNALGLTGFLSQATGGGSIVDVLNKIKSAGINGGGSRNTEKVFDEVQSNNPSLSNNPFFNEGVATVVGGAARSLGIIGEGFEDLLLQSQGYAQNPQMEVLFDNTDFRQFEYTFNFLPRNEIEAEAVGEIIRTLRFYSAPELYSGSGRYYVPPYYFELTYMMRNSNNGGWEVNKHMPKISTCVLTSIDVDYVGDSGQFVTFPDGRPVNIKMILRFKEIEVIHKALINQGY